MLVLGQQYNINEGVNAIFGEHNVDLSMRGGDKI
jgi:hypothetical protein